MNKYLCAINIVSFNNITLKLRAEILTTDEYRVTHYKMLHHYCA